MKTIAKIALSIPDTEKPGRYFSLRLKQEIYDEPSEYGHPPKLLAISDIEGNFKPFYDLLIKSRVINKHLDWIYEDGHVVILGDCFDRGDHVTECLWLIYMLEEKARRRGGKVHFILGNHEIMNLNGDWRYVHPKYAEQTKSQKIHSALYGGNSELWRWLLTKNIIEKIGNLLFVHGGISGQLLQYNLSVKEINMLARPWYTKANQLMSDPILHTLFNSDHSPFWYRGFYQNEVKEEQIDAALQYFGVTTIITGHTVMDSIAPFFNGKVINIDTDHAAGRSEALLIRKGRFYKVDDKGKKEKLNIHV